MYIITGRKSGSVSFLPRQGTITQETATRTSKLTSNAIEGGSTIEDHVSLNPEQLQIEGVVVKNHEYFRSRLEAMWKSRDLVSYVGKIRVSDYVITNLQIKNLAENRDGFRFSATLQKANIVSGQYVEIGQTLLMSEQDAGEEISSSDQANTQTDLVSQTNQTAKEKAAGLQTTVSQQISQSAYAAYVDSYNGKSSSGPAERAGSGYNGM